MMGKIVTSLAVFIVLTNYLAAGKLEISFKPVPKSPKHIMAVWIEDSKGKYVKSLAVFGKKRLKYLKKWNNVSDKDKTDAVTGATIKKPSLCKYTWNCTDINGKQVKPGKYCVMIEFTSRNGQGPRTDKKDLEFEVGGKDTKLTPKDTKNFKNVVLKYTDQ